MQGHPDAKKVPGVDASTGSLGQGVSIAVGMALGAKHLGKDTKVFALVGDGESQEGQIWEAYMAAAHYNVYLSPSCRRRVWSASVSASMSGSRFPPRTASRLKFFASPVSRWSVTRFCGKL